MSLFDNREKREINISLFTDERKNISDRWNYISTIIIPTSKFNSVYDTLMKHRTKINYHGEMKFADIGRSGGKLELAKLWLSEILNDEDKKIYFKILGLDRKLFEEDRFGEGCLKKGANYANLYNRFFRTNVLSVKYFFKNFDEITIDRIFHDNEGNLENHEYFDWHCIWKLKQEEKIKSGFDKVVFINSDHNLEKKHPKVSQIIQLSDILVGTISHCLDYRSFTKKIKNHKGRNELGEILYPLIKRILQNPNNRNSSYKYFRKYDINFFPMEVPTELQNLQQYLHRNRPVEIGLMIDKKENEDKGQKSLF